MALEHTSRDFESELRDLRSRATRMGARSERGLAMALEVVWQGSAELAANVRDLEALTDGDEVDITAMVVRILALRQPLARDLRFLTATLKLVTDLERIGDEAGHIAKRAMEEPAPTRSLAREELEPMAGRAQQALRDALHSFFDEDPASAARALASSDVVHEEYNAVVARLSERMAKRSADVVGGMLIIRVAKHLERVAGHAASVAEEAVFFVRGEYVRHDRTGSRSLP